MQTTPKHPHFKPKSFYVIHPTSKHIQKLSFMTLEEIQQAKAIRKA